MNYPNKPGATALCIAATAILMSASPAATAFSPNLISGCKAIAEKQKNVSGREAVHAAYCLGVLDGIVTVLSKQQTGVPLPDPCFSKTILPMDELAGQVVRVLTEQPKIVELAKRSASDRGSMAAYLALAMANRCGAAGQ